MRSHSHLPFSAGQVGSGSPFFIHQQSLPMKHYVLPIIIFFISLSISGQQGGQQNRRTVTLSGSYYTKQAFAGGMHILASDKAPDSCLVRVGEQLNYLTAHVKPEVRKVLNERQVRVVAMGRYEGITELPEFKNHPDIEPYWDIHVRGWGATPELPVMLCAEENVLAYQIDPNYAEDILVNSFAKTLFSMAISTVDSDALSQLGHLFTRAKMAGKWKNTTAAKSVIDYWAEGIQSWFDLNAESPLPNGEHNWVNTHDDLMRYDPELYAFIGKYLTYEPRIFSRHPYQNLYRKDNPKAWARLHREKKLNIDVPTCTVQSVSSDLASRLHLDTSFYKKHVNCNGIHILSSDQVPDSCLVQAHKTIYCMTSMLPKEVLNAMTKVNTRVVVMGRKEVTIQVPEHSGMVHDRSINWNLRARGLGGTIQEPITSCAEENIMAHPWDKYHAEDILIHEFSHSIHLIGILQVDPTINQQLRELLNKAKAEGKWENTYAGTVFEEYWAEGVQNWFNVNAETPYPDTKHNQVNTREELKKYDPGLYELIAKYFPETNAQISKHKKENIYRLKSKK